MNVKIKICGITNYEDAKVAANLGVDALGFIFFENSPRYISPEDAGEIIKKLPPFIAKVGVFVDATPTEIMAVAQKSGIDTVQLHGNEPPSAIQRLPFTVIKAFSVKPGWDMSVIESYEASGYLLDTWNDKARGGTGMTFDWSIARKAVTQYHHIILAGGLGPVNIKEALDNVHPYAVDINSGVEVKPGIKNPHKMKELVHIVRSWGQ